MAFIIILINPNNNFKYLLVLNHQLIWSKKKKKNHPLMKCSKPQTPCLIFNIKFKTNK